MRRQSWRKQHVVELEDRQSQTVRADDDPRLKSWWEMAAKQDGDVGEVFR